MQKHIQVLGILNIVWGSFGLVAALVIIAIFGGVVGLLQAAAHKDADAQFAVPIIGLIGGLIILILLVASLPSIIAGIGLLSLAPWSRMLAIVVSALHLLNVPLGTALGIYGLWVLLSDESIRLFGKPEHPVKL